MIYDWCGDSIKRYVPLCSVADMGLEFSHEKTIKLADKSKKFKRIIKYKQYKKTIVFLQLY